MSSAVRNSNTYCPTHLLGIPKSVCWRLSNQMRLRSPHHFTNKGTYMLLLHKRELNHLWKALKISNVLKSWDLSDVSIPYKRAKNPQILHSKLRRLPCKPRWETASGCFVHALTSVLRKGGLYDHMVCLSASVPCTNPFPALLSPLAITASCEKLHWRSSSIGSWTGVSHGGNHLESCYVLRTRKTQLELIS